MNNADQPASRRKIVAIKKRIAIAEEAIRIYKNDELSDYERIINLNVAKVISNWEATLNRERALLQQLETTKPKP